MRGLLRENQLAFLFLFASYWTMWMDVGAAFRGYVTRIISSVDGMKILLLDRETVHNYWRFNG